jgi:hypothetical protein
MEKPGFALVTLGTDKADVDKSSVLTSTDIKDGRMQA